MAKSDIYVANETFAATSPTGEPAVVHRGVTRVRSGHWLLDGREHMFDPAEDRVQFDVETTTSAPGERRGTPAAAEPEPVAEPSADVEAETGTVEEAQAVVEESKVYTRDELAQLRRADREAIARERGVMPETGSGANGAVVMDDVIDAILRDQA
jgi:hypothetical protein